MPLRPRMDSVPPTGPPAGSARRLLVLGAVTALLVTGCAQDGAETPVARPAGQDAAGSPATDAAVQVRVAPADAAVEHNPAEPVTVRADRGELTEVVLEPGTGGASVPGERSADGRTWTSSEPLAFDTRYVLRWTAEADGTQTSGSSSFTTVVAAHEVDARINVVDGEVYGTGQVLELRFSEPVRNKDAVERALTVRGGGDHRGALRWYSDQLVRYRPAETWQPHSEVTVSLDLLGLDVGEGMIGNADVRRTFSIGAEHYARVDNETKTLTAYVDGKETASFPVTLGNPDWPSTTGRKVIMEQAPSYLFNASSLDLAPGDPHWYETFWASNVSRLTASGEFIHQALPSALPLLGVQNVSHGCVGMPPEGAKYIFDTFRPGDVVEVLNTGYPQADPDDGYGDWNIPFEHYADESWQGDW